MYREDYSLDEIVLSLTVSVIGCIVNSRGEARETDIGFTGGGNGTHQVYISGLTRPASKMPTSSTALSSWSRKRRPRSRPENSGRAKPGSQRRSRKQQPCGPWALRAV